MLKKISDYRLLKEKLKSLDVGIKGRIIPTEDINKQNHPLRRENFAYLAEAAAERLEPLTNAWVEFFNVIPPKNGTLNKKYNKSIGNVIRLNYEMLDGEAYHSDRNYFLKNEATNLPVKFSPYQSFLFPARYIKDYKDFLVSSKDSHISTSEFNKDGKTALSLDYMRRCFYDVNKLNTALIASDYPYPHPIGEAYQRENFNIEGGRAVVKLEGGRIFSKAINAASVNDRIKVNVTDEDGAQYRIQLQANTPYHYSKYYIGSKEYLTEEYFETKYNYDMNRYNSVKSVKAIVPFSIMGVKSGSLFSTNINYPMETKVSYVQTHGVEVMRCSYEINYSLLKNIHGLAETQIKGKSSSFDYVSIRMNDPYALINYDYKTRLPAEWTWKPE